MTASNARTGAVPAVDRNAREWTWANWALALLTAPAAVLVMIRGPGTVTSTAICRTLACASLPWSGFASMMLYVGAAVVACVTILISFFTAPRPVGTVVPLCAWVFLAGLALCAL